MGGALRGRGHTIWGNIVTVYFPTCCRRASKYVPRYYWMGQGVASPVG